MPRFHKNPVQSAGSMNQSSSVTDRRTQIVSSNTPTSAKLAQQRKRCARSTRPVCTHTSMVRIHSNNLACHLCGLTPRIGFIYACEQDHVAPSSMYSNRAKSVSGLPNPSPQEKGRGASLRRLLQLALPSSDRTAKLSDLNSWVAIAAGDGEYTDTQIETLVAQKAHVRQMIMVDQAQRDMPSKAAVLDRVGMLGLQPSPEDMQLLSECLPYATDSAPRLELDGISSTSARQPGAMCGFHVCHTCRPASRDRVWLSFESALNDELSPPSEWHSGTMPVSDRATVACIGLSAKLHHAQFFEPIDEDESGCSISGGTNIQSPLLPSLSRDVVAQQSIQPQYSAQDFQWSIHQGLVGLLEARQNEPQLTQSQLAQDPDLADGSESREDDRIITEAIAQINAGASIASLERHGVVTRLWRALASEEQSLAAATPLPGEDDLRDRAELQTSIPETRLTRSPAWNNAASTTQPASAENASGDIESGEGVVVTLTEEAAGYGPPDIVICSP